jgi:hypothetical protein
VDPTAEFAQLQLGLIDHIQWRYEVIRPLVLFANRTAPQRAQETDAHPDRTYRTEPAITRHLFYLLVKKGIISVLSGVRDGRNREGNTPLTVKIDLFRRFKGTMTSYLSFRAVGPSPEISRGVSGVPVPSGARDQ